MVHGGSFARGGVASGGKGVVVNYWFVSVSAGEQTPGRAPLMTATNDCGGLSGCGGSGIF